MNACLDEVDAACDDHAHTFCALVVERDRAGG
jgi:hypothetical protein